MHENSVLEEVEEYSSQRLKLSLNSLPKMLYQMRYKIEK